MSKGQTWISADWHGCWDPAYKVLNFLQPDDTFYFLGDAIDRGPDGIKILEALMNRPNTFFIKGNHEDMMLKNLPFMIKDLKEIYCFEIERYPCQEWFSNGAWKTIENGLVGKSIEDLSKYENFLNKLPLQLEYYSPKGYTIILEHAGYTPFNFFYRHKYSHDPLWDRRHFYDEWNHSNDPELENVYLIHGHTPVQYLKYFYGYKDQPPKTKEDIADARLWNSNEYKKCSKPTILHYCSNHKIDIDMCTIASGRIALLNLDTFEEIYFDKGDNK